MDTRIAVLILWGGGVVFLFGVVLLRRLGAWHQYRDRAARREMLEALALFITAVASGSIVSVLTIPEVTSVRSFLVALSLGAFVGVGIIMATEDPRPERRREVRKNDGVSPPYDPAGLH